MSETLSVYKVYNTLTMIESGRESLLVTKDRLHQQKQLSSLYKALRRILINECGHRGLIQYILLYVMYVLFYK